MARRPKTPSSGSGAGSPAIGAKIPCRCTVEIAPKTLKLYVSEPKKTLTAKAEPGGGTFTWTSSDSSKLTISGSGRSVTLESLTKATSPLR